MQTQLFPAQLSEHLVQAPWPWHIDSPLGEASSICLFILRKDVKLGGLLKLPSQHPDSGPASLSCLRVTVSLAMQPDAAGPSRGPSA